MITRGLHFSFDTSEDAALATLFYPGDGRRLDEARLTGQVPALEADAPWPVAVLMPGINVAPDGYRWLAKRLVAGGLCAVTYAAIGSLGPAGRGITPGLDLSALVPEVIGTRRSSTALEPLLARVGEMAEADTPVAGLVDLGQVVVGGHSAGGTVALHNSDPAWVPGLRAVFAYGAHTMVATALGHGTAAVAPIPAKVPVMLLGGAADGVIAASRDRYGPDDADPGLDHDADHRPVRRTFAEAIGHKRGDSWLVELAGAGHFAICDPVDTTSGRAFLEEPAMSGSFDAGPSGSETSGSRPSGAGPAGAETSGSGSKVRELLGDLIAAFIAESLGRSPATGLEELVEHRLVENWDRR